MANEEQLSILKQGVDVWNKWRYQNRNVEVDLSGADLSGANLRGTDLRQANLRQANLSQADLFGADLIEAKLSQADLFGADLIEAKLSRADLSQASLYGADLSRADLRQASLYRADLSRADLSQADPEGCTFSETRVGSTIFGNCDLSKAIGLEDVRHREPSIISTGTFALSKGKISEVFLRGCGLSDWEIEHIKLYSPDLSNEEINNIQYKIYDLRATQALQISPLFVSYSHKDSEFVDKVGDQLTKKGIRYWRDTHDMKSGRIEKQISQAIRHNPTVLLVLSEHSLSSDWVEHEVRTARGLEKEMERDVLCPVALDDSWKDNKWPKRIMEQIMEYNILDFSAWQDNSKFDAMFRKLIDGLGLFYNG